MKHSVEFALDDQQSAFISEMVKQGRFSDVIERAEYRRIAELEVIETQIAAGFESGPSIEWEGMEALIREASQTDVR